MLALFLTLSHTYSVYVLSKLDILRTGCEETCSKCACWREACPFSVPRLRNACDGHSAQDAVCDSSNLWIDRGLRRQRSHLPLAILSMISLYIPQLGEPGRGERSNVWSHFPWFTVLPSCSSQVGVWLSAIIAKGCKVNNGVCGGEVYWP